MKSGRNIHIELIVLLYAKKRSGEGNGRGLEYCATCTRRTSRQQVKVRQLFPRSRRMEQSVYTFFVHWTLGTNYQWQRFVGCPSSKSDWTLSYRHCQRSEKSSLFVLNKMLLAKSMSQRQMSFTIHRYLAFASKMDDVDARAYTDRQTKRLSLGAHAHLGFIEIMTCKHFLCYYFKHIKIPMYFM